MPPLWSWCGDSAHVNDTHARPHSRPYPRRYPSQGTHLTASWLITVQESSPDPQNGTYQTSSDHLIDSNLVVWPSTCMLCAAHPLPRKVTASMSVPRPSRAAHLNISLRRSSVLDWPQLQMHYALRASREPWGSGSPTDSSRGQGPRSQRRRILADVNVRCGDCVDDSRYEWAAATAPARPWEGSAAQAHPALGARFDDRLPGRVHKQQPPAQVASCAVPRWPPRRVRRGNLEQMPDGRFGSVPRLLRTSGALRLDERVCSSDGDQPCSGP